MQHDQLAELYSVLERSHVDSDRTSCNVNAGAAIGTCTELTSEEPVELGMHRRRDRRISRIRTAWDEFENHRDLRLPVHAIYN